jgi:hypothetical protein
MGKFRKSIDDCVEGKKKLEKKLDDVHICYYRPFAEDTHFCKYLGSTIKVGGQDYYLCDKKKYK